MTKTNLNSEDRILKSSCEIFVLYGYHATTLQKIATKASVSKASIHYYFRSKEKLYGIVVELIIDFILGADFDFSANRDRVENSIWFLSTELYNNRHLFEHTLKGLHPDDWESRLNRSVKLAEFIREPGV